MILRIALAAVALLFSVGTLFIATWIVVPGPIYRLFMLSVAGKEFSLWFSLTSLIGIVLGIVALRNGSHVAGIIAIICGVIALFLTAIPTLQARSVAQQEHVPLSLGRYFFGTGQSTLALNVTRDVTYAEVDGATLRLDVYQSGARGAAAPAVIVVHGGSWASGTKGEFADFSRTLAGAGFVVLDMDYRLANDTQRFPAQVADVKCAVGWLKHNARGYGVDPDRIALLGRSAGSQLALLAAYTAQDPALPPSCDAGDTTVKAVISYYGPTDLVWGYYHPSRQRRVSDGQAVLRNYIGATPATAPDLYRLASPITHVNATTPPTLLLHGGSDQFVGLENTHLLDRALQQAGVAHRVVILPWANHGFDFTPQGWGSQITEPIVLEFLHTYLGN